MVGKTSDALIEAGIPSQQIRWDASKIKTTLEKHNGMSSNVIKQVPRLLENPVVVIDSKTDAQSKIVMGELYDDNGKIVTAVLKLNPTSKKGNQLDLIKISSTQGRGHIESLFKYENGTSVAVRYVDKKRIQSWLNVNRLQLPLHSFNLDSNNNIPQNSENSSGKTDYSLSEEQESNYNKAVKNKDLETTQKIVDEVPSDTSRVLKRGYSLTNSTKSISHTERNVNSDDKAPIKNNKISLSEEGEVPSKYGRFFVKDLMYRSEDIAPVQPNTEDSPATASKTEKVGTVKVNSLKIKGSRQNSNSEDILSRNSEKSSGKTDYSLSPEQETYFKDSKVRDENGNLKVMYHGTSGDGFNFLRQSCLKPSVMV